MALFMTLHRRDFQAATFLLCLQFAFWSWVVLTLLRPIQATDVWWQLASGRYIASHHSIPLTDVFSLTCRGNRWVDFEWLYQLVLFSAYSLGNLYGITALKVGGIVLAMSFLIRRFRQTHIPEIGIYLAALIVFTACSPGWSERADLVSIALVSALMNDLEGMRSGTLPMTRRWRWCLIFLFWANAHGGGVPIGLGIAGLYGIDYVLAEQLSWKQLSVWLILIFTSTLLTPFGIHLWKQIVQSVLLISHAAQTEFRPPPWNHMLIFWMAFVLHILVLLRQLETGHKIPWRVWALTFVFGYEATQHARFAPFFMFVAFPFGVQALWIHLGKRQNKLTEYRSFSTLVVAGIFSLWAMAQIPRVRIGIRSDVVPVEACDFIVAHHIGGRFYTDIDYGSYWIWRFAGDPPAFIDGRSSTVEGYMNLRQEIRRAQQGPPSGWQHFLDKYEISAVLIPHPASSVPTPVFAAYFPKTRWSLVYRDDLALLFLRRVAYPDLHFKQL